MQFRQSMINLGITCVLVLLVAVAAVLLRGCHPLPAQQQRAVPVAVPVAVAELVGGMSSGPKERPVEERFLTFPNPKLLDSSANEADTLRLQVAKEEHVFVLYYVDALDASPAHPDRINEQASYFGKASPQSVLETGREAWSYVKELLNTRKFLVLTRWEKVPNTDRFYALIRVQDESGKWFYLADLLVRQGYARVAGVQTPLPDNLPSVENYIGELMGHAKYARQKKLGIWSRVQ